MTRAEEELQVSELMPLARQMALLFIKDHARFALDDALSHAIEGVWEAVRKYESGPGAASLRTMASRMALWRMSDAYRRVHASRSTNSAHLKRAKNPVSLDQLPASVVDRLMSRESAPDANTNFEDWLTWLLRGCNRRERDIVRRHIVRGEPLYVVASDLGCSTSRCSGVMCEVLSKLRDKLCPA